MNRGEDGADRAFRRVRWAIRAFPPAFRRRWREELEDDLRRVLAEPGSRPLRVALGLVRSGVQERWRATARGGSRNSGVGEGTMRTMGWAAMRQEIGFALRSLRRRPGFAAVAIGTIALGIGANTTVFSVVDGVLLRPLPFQEPEQLVRIGGYREGETPEIGSVSHPEINEMEGLSAFSSVLAFRSSEVALTGMGAAEMVSAARVTRGVFHTLGGPPILGRDFRPEEANDPSTRLAIVSWDFWTTRWGADPEVIGRTLTLDSESWEVIGVAPPRAVWPRGFDLWLPGGMPVEGGCWWGCTIFSGLARLAPGTSIEQAEAELASFALRIEELAPQQVGRRYRIDGLQAFVVSDVREAIWILLGAVGIVLLIACANLAQLFLARGTTRAGEFAVRRALGAPKGRLVLSVLSESLVIALVGGALGVGLAVVAVDLLPGLTEGTVPRAQEIGLHPTVLLFSLGLTLASALLFGLVPGLRAARGSRLGVEMRASGRGGTSRRGPQSLLLTGEVALSLVLLVGAGLLLRTFGEISSTDLGFRTEGITRFDVSLPDAGYEEEANVRSFVSALQAGLERLPAVEGVSIGVSPPLSQDQIGGGFRFLDRPEPAPGEGPRARVHVHTPGFFDLYGIALKAGRVFDLADRPGQPTAYVVNEAFVRRYFEDGQDPLGEPLRLGIGFGYSREEGRIVGVVEDVRSSGVGEVVVPALYVSHPQLISAFFTVSVATQGGEPLEASRVAEVVGALDPDVPPARFEAMEEVVAQETASTRFYLTLIGSFALLALVMAGVGLYGVVAYSVSRRTREIGLRAALGADSDRIVRMVLQQGLLPTGIGIGVGLIGAAAISRLLRTILYEVEPLDPITFAAVPVVLVVVSVVATLVPARRAARVHPVEALRAE